MTAARRPPKKASAAEEVEAKQEDPVVIGVPERPAQRPFPVVGVGASAGGLDAFRRLLGQLPSESGMAFVLVQHLAPQHESRLSELLSKSTILPVVEAVNGKTIEVNNVYVIPPNSNIALSNGVLHVTPRGDAHTPHLPVDHLFRSLAEDQQGRAIGVVLSGTGSDGTLGLEEIKAVGGITFAQDETSAAYPGMPGSARDSGCADFVLGPEDIAKRLLDIVAHPYLTAAGEVRDDEGEPDEAFRQVLTIVRKVVGVDFNLYRKTTIRRRIMRRMALHSHQLLQDYVERLRKDSDEVLALYHDLLVNVTSFFRDPDMFESLKRVVFPELARRKPPSQPYRFWVPGCSTGQEAYSIAIALLEYHDGLPTRPSVQIFATDLSDRTSLDKARAGVYPDTIEAEISPDRLRRFFKKEDHIYRIDKSIRDMCVFARQNVTADPPFSHLDLISCRNVLIYLATPLQKRVMPTFHYALDAPGFLVLGSAESVGDHNELFEMVDRTNKIYRKKLSAARIPVHFSGEDFRVTSGTMSLRPSATTAVDYQKEADRILLGRFAPPAVLVNLNFDVVQFRGRTSPYLEAPSGEPTSNVLKLAREGLFLDLRSALGDAKKTSKPAKRAGVRIVGEHGVREILLEVLPVAATGDDAGCFLVVFHDAQAQAKAATALAAAAAAKMTAEAERVRVGRIRPGTHKKEVERLRQELAATKEYLQSLAEQQDAANEELRSANEEILSSNEELQSTNEELETAKEELQSTNEELTTVNEQLNQRNAELTQVNNDLTNLVSSTNIPLVMVGADLRIRRFTGAAKRLMNLLPTDVGRPIGDIRTIADIGDLDAMITEVIEQVQTGEREVRDRDGRWYTLRISPYRTLDNKIDGAVILLVDVDQIRKGQDELREKTVALKHADRQKDHFLATLAHELRNPIAPMRNSVELLRLGGDDPETIERVRQLMDRQVRQLSGIVEELIDVSRIVEHKINLPLQRVSVESVIQTSVESTRDFIESCGHKLIVELPREPVFLDADPVRLSQVLVNLLNNAAKFTPSGGTITLIAHAVHDGDDPSRTEAVVRVRDTGVGLPKDSLPRIFEMFEQGPAPQHGSPGLGIGLPVVRSVVEMHRGTVEVRSDGPGTGSEFVIRLPAADPASPSPSAVEEESVPAGPDGSPERKILIVDDNRDQAESMGKVLELLGHDVRLSYDGETALEEAVRFLPDVMLLDLGLPKMSGYDVAERVKADPKLERTLLVAQTGWSQEQDRERTRKAGFAHHLVKPVDLAELKRILASIHKDGPA